MTEDQAQSDAREFGQWMREMRAAPDLATLDRMLGFVRSQRKVRIISPVIIEHIETVTYRETKRELAAKARPSTSLTERITGDRA